eukprot:GHVS01083362.1.p1 GENE.GHVS01083362.1~~GHVS01083362.1.p1  ORF type:complete len:133 (+),score=13.51 GHVS01083362.1:199-597(+)
MRLDEQTETYFKKFVVEHLETSSTSKVLHFTRTGRTSGHLANVRVSHNNESISAVDGLLSKRIAFDYKPAEGAALYILKLETTKHRYAMAFEDGATSNGVLYGVGLLEGPSEVPVACSRGVPCECDVRALLG